MSNRTQKVFTSRTNNLKADEFVGERGRLFYDEPDSPGVAPILRYSDGETVGGIPISGGSSGALSVVTLAASGGGSLTYTNGVFYFAPAQVGSGVSSPFWQLTSGTYAVTLSDTAGELAVPGPVNFVNNGSLLGPPVLTGFTDKIRLWDVQSSNPTGYNYAIGVENENIWFSVNSSTDAGGFKFYSTGTEIFKVGSTGILHHSGGVTQKDEGNTLCPANQDTVIFTSNTVGRVISMRLFITVQGSMGADPDQSSYWETQSCDIIAVYGIKSRQLSLETFGIIYSGDDILARFDGFINTLTNTVCITCRPTNGTNPVYATAYAVQAPSLN